MPDNIIVLDANILIRAVLGIRVREKLLDYCNVVGFFTPDVCVDDAKRYLPDIFKKRLLPAEPALETLSKMECLLSIVDKDIYGKHENNAKKRIKTRDINDWPILATAMALNCPIWTEDQDFFGTGVPAWTSNNIHIFLEDFTLQRESEEYESN
jgi:predicted nucleic acid-binding protein